MDVIKSTKGKKSIFSKKAQLVLMLVSMIVGLTVWASNSSGGLAIDREDLLVDTIKHGDLEVIIDGFGTLTSNKQQLITAYSSATVKEIILKPGAQVQADSIIVRLENPELLQQLESAQQELIQTKANLRQLKLNNQRERLNESASLAEITARFETVTLTRQAQESLVKTGIVSKLTFQETMLEEAQLKKRVDIFERRNEQLMLVHQESVNIQKERINQQQGRVNIAQSRIDKLTVKAGFDGVLQRLSVELGQSVASGQEIALIGSVTDLIALIRVPQNQVQQIHTGQHAVIDTRRDKIKGTVVRVDPVVVENTVEVEIALPKVLPASARPQLNVDGVITADTLENVSYIKRPAGIKSNSTAQLYKIDDTQQHARLHELTFGQQAGNYIEVVSGASTKDKFIISDLRHIQNTHSALVIE